MQLSSIIEAIVVLFMIIAVGWGLRVRGVVTPNLFPVLGIISLDIALPCLVFATILTRFDPEAMPGWYKLPVSWAILTLVLFISSMLAGFAARPVVRREFRFCCFYQNAFFFPLAIMTEIYGAGSSEVAGLFLMTFLFPAFFFNTYPMFFSSKLRMDWKRSLHPVLIVTLAAVLLSLSGAGRYVPKSIVKALVQIGAVTVPLLMILLGARLKSDFGGAGGVFWREMVLFVLIRNIAFPFILMQAFCRMDLPLGIGFLLLLQSAMPPITAAPVVIEREGGNAAFAAQLLVASYIAGLFTIPLAAFIFIRLTA